MLGQASPVSDTATTVSGASFDLVRLVVIFGVIALALVLLAMLHRNWKRGDGKIFTVTFGRTFGLIVIATLAVTLALTSVDTEAKSGAFALLGTIAGYLAAGSRSTTPDPALHATIRDNPEDSGASI